MAARFSRPTRFAVVGGASWLLVSLLLLLADEERGILAFYLILLLLYGLVLFGFLFYRLIPRLRRKGQGAGRYVGWAAGVLLVLLPVMFVIVLALMNDPEAGASFALLNAAFHLLITTPLAWVLARRGEQLAELETELGHTTANLDSLRAQINPHFLFNALNTLYGLALQEKSERTAEGIQRLGDMMRFMLHENQQPRILLAREVEYLRNYMELQSLRVAASPNLTIETSIEEAPGADCIAPMLLIPFVENAFKHGISLKHKSWITVALRYEPGKLCFDVRNSIHPHSEKDRLERPSGLGLANVQQRLTLLYPGRHELLIRETPDEYLVHLALTL